MSDQKSKKRKVIEISSSDESESSAVGSDDDDVEEINSSSSCDDDDDDDDEGDCDGSETEEENECNFDEESMCNKVIRFVGGRSDLQELKLVECKAYLRSHGLRISGTKEECIERIKEHWRLRDQNGEALYPRSSFTIDCTGDVCKGDVVLFNQKVYQTFDKMRRHGSPGGRRTVAGRIIKESYGAARQQHTFTVEVLWSRGTKKLAPLFPLLVKGRNLYKLRTFRQAWKNENERSQILAEKHRRGAAARTARAMRRQKSEMRTNKSIMYKGAKKCKPVLYLGQSKTRKTAPVKNNLGNGSGKALVKKNKWTPRQNFSPALPDPIQTRDLRTSGSYSRHQNQPQVREPTFFLYNNDHSKSLTRFDQFDVCGRELHQLPPYRVPALYSRLPQSYPVRDHALRPVSQFMEFNSGSFMGPVYSHSRHASEPMNLDRSHRLIDFHPSFYSSPTNRHRWR